MINEEKKYQKAIERAKKELDACGSLDCDAARQIFRLFPELQSIKNEKIKNNIIKLLRFVRDTYHQYSDECNEAIAWLEKQDEEKPAGKVEPKFKVGDWIVWNKISCHVENIYQNIYQGKNYLMYTIKDTNNMIRSYSAESFDNNAHLWTIQDAKDGDVLVNNDNIFLFDGTLEEKLFPFTHCGIIDKEFRIYDRKIPFTHSTYSYPATKEQRDLLFQKMKEAGYEWDVEKKELNKIEHNSAWSEDDEKFLNYAISLTDDAQIINFLKSLKDRMQPYLKWKKAKEDRVVPNWVVKLNKDGNIIVSYVIYKGEYFITLQSLDILPKEE